MIRFRTALFPLAVASAVLLSSERPAAWGFAAHRFIAEKAIDLLPIEIRPYFQKHRAFIVEHGSWNRRQRAGYQVVFVPFKASRASAPQPFLSGFVPDPASKQVYGRPSGVAVSPDGTVFVADDGADVIWQIRPNR